MTNSIVANSTLQLPEVQAVLERLHNLADANDKTIIQQVLSSGYDWKSASSEQNAATFREALLPISPDVGRFLYGVARSISAERIVEFGTSYGISTIYLAAAVRDLNSGLVIGSEMESSKVMQATENLATAELLPFVEIRAGDALETLRDLGGTIDLLFLDGWKKPLFRCFTASIQEPAIGYGHLSGRSRYCSRPTRTIFRLHSQPRQRLYLCYAANR